MAKVENLVQTENGPRFARTGTYKGRTIEVATGYNVVADDWPAHLYFHDDGMRKKVGGATNDSLQASFEWGFEFAQHLIDSGV